jgi:hypothetical protein
MIKGIQNFNYKITEVNNMSNSSPTLSPISSSINDVLSGNTYSHDSVQSQLQTLNSLVKCASFEFGMILTSTAALKSITDKSQIQAGACYNQSTAENLRALLEASFLANRTSFSTLSSRVTSAQSNYQTNVTALKTARTDFNTIYLQLEDAFSKMSVMQADFYTTFNCKILQ